MLEEQLRKAWRARAATAGIDPSIRFAQGGLVMGADTVLARVGQGRDVAIDELRLTALLAAAHLRAPSAQAVAHLRRAVHRWRQGEDILAATHLALSGLNRLAGPAEDAERLFLADALLVAGLGVDELLNALGLSPVGDPLGKYSPDQPRVPAGSGRTSGEWTSEDGADSSPATPQRSNHPTRTKRPGRRPSAAQPGVIPMQSPGVSHAPSRQPEAGRVPPNLTEAAVELPTASATPIRGAATTASGPQATPQLNLGGLPIADLVRLGSFLAGVSAKAGPAGVLAIGYLLYRAGLSSKPIDPAGLGGVTFRYGDGGQASSTLFEPTTAFPPHGDGDYQPAPGVPAPLTPELRLLDQLASEADKAAPRTLPTPVGDIPIPAWLRGILVHAEFARLVSAAFGADHAEASYILGEPARYGAPGSVRADAIVGSIAAPIFVADLKTANAYLTTGQIRQYYRNLPKGTVVVEIRLPP